MASPGKQEDKSPSKKSAKKAARFADDDDEGEDAPESPITLNIAKHKEAKGLVSEMITGNPEMLAAIQAKLGSLIGADSGLLETLPESVKRRLRALKKLQGEHRALERQFEAETRALEAKYAALYKPIFEKRTTITSGAYEPKDEELGEPLDEEEGAAPVPEPAEPIVGVPKFWLNVLQSSDAFQQQIQENDEDALTALTDITTCALEDNKPGFHVDFHFAPNPFFSDRVIRKSYFLTEGEDQLRFDHADATKINWLPGKNLTVKMVKKKVGKGRARKVVQKEEMQESFFNFFSPPPVPSQEDQDEMEDEDLQELEMAMEMDFDFGQELKEKIIPRAVSYYLGEVEQQQIFDGDDDEGEGDFDDEDDEDEAAMVAQMRAMARGGGGGGHGHSHAGGHGHSHAGGHGHSHGGDDDDDDEEDDADYAPKKGEKPAECKQQ